MSTSILFVCRYERYFLSLYFLCPPVCMKFWPISGCNPFTQVHWFCRTDCWLYDLRYLDLKSCCLRLAFFPGAQLWLLSLWLWFAVGSNLPAGFSYVMQQAPLRARWGRPVMQLRYQIPMWSCTTAPWATSVFYTGRCRCQQTVECDCVFFFNPFWYFPPCRTAECKLCAVNLFRRHCTGGNIICGDVASCLFEPSAKLLDRDFPQILNFFPWLSPNTNPSSSCIGDACITDSEELLAMTSLFGIYCRNLNLPLNSTSCLSTVTQSL